MSQIYITEHGKIRNFDDAEAAEEIVKMRQKRDPWDVIDKMVHLWAEKAPEEVDAMRVNVQQYRETRDDKEFGTTGEEGKHMERRMILSFPRSLMMMIRTQYKADELPFNQDFYRKFAKRYPVFQIPEKI